MQKLLTLEQSYYLEKLSIQMQLIYKKMCKELGFNVFFQTVVGDNPQRFLDCLNIAFNRGCDCVITTGGLGPTEDDLTKELSAKYLGLEMIFK